jgi:hypothetical protein
MQFKINLNLLLIVIFLLSLTIVDGKPVEKTIGIICQPVGCGITADPNDIFKLVGAFADAVKDILIGTWGNIIQNVG